MILTSLQRCKWLFIAASLLVGCLSCYGARVEPNHTPVDTAIALREVMVSGRRKPLATVQSLSGAELQSLSSTSIADALKYFAGVQIKDYGGLGGLKTINVRSLGAQHVGIYIDGVRVTNAQNGTVDPGQIFPVDP